MQGIHGIQTGHEQQGWGGGGGGLLQQFPLPPPLQHVDGHLGAHIHQTLQGEQEHPVQGWHGLQVVVVVGGSVVVVGVVGGSVGGGVPLNLFG